MELKLTSLLQFILVGVVSSHGNMLNPFLRPGPNEHWGYCSPEQKEPGKTACQGPCHTPYNPEVYKYTPLPVHKRGDQMEVAWLRQNHPGGFVRVSIVPADKSNNPSVFDKAAHFYTCYETNCSQDHPHEFGMNDKIGANIDNSPKNRCSTQIKIPPNLKDGIYTLQWLWFAGGFNYGDVNASFGNYYSCSDFKISGGPSGSRPAPIFRGGDAYNRKEGQCRYWGKPDTHSCRASTSAQCPAGRFKQGAPTEFLRSRK